MFYCLLKYLITPVSLSMLLMYSRVSASCLDRPPFTNIADDDALSYVELIFPLCSRTQECKIALSGPENLQFIDVDKYAFLKGCALANGDCLQQDLQQAQRFLESCAQNSYSCKKALMYMYAIHMPDKIRYNNLALELIKEGLDDVALGYMIDYYLAQNSQSGNIKAYFMSAILLLNTDKTIKRYKQNQNNINEIKELHGYRDYLANFINNLTKSMSKEEQDSIWNEAENMVKWHNSAQKTDPLAHLDRIYGINGEVKAHTAVVPPKKQEPRINTDVAKELKQILEDLENIKK